MVVPPVGLLHNFMVSIVCRTSCGRRWRQGARSHRCRRRRSRSGRHTSSTRWSRSTTTAARSAACQPTQTASSSGGPSSACPTPCAPATPLKFPSNTSLMSDRTCRDARKVIASSSAQIPQQSLFLMTGLAAMHEQQAYRSRAANELSSSMFKTAACDGMSSWPGLCKELFVLPGGFSDACGDEATVHGTLNLSELLPGPTGWKPARRRVLQGCRLHTRNICGFPVRLARPAAHP